MTDTGDGVNGTTDVSWMLRRSRDALLSPRLRARHPVGGGVPHSEAETALRCVRCVRWGRTKFPQVF